MACPIRDKRLYLRLQTWGVGYAVAAVDCAAALEVGEAAAGFFDDDFQGRKIPRRGLGFDPEIRMPTRD